MTVSQYIELLKTNITLRHDGNYHSLNSDDIVITKYIGDRKNVHIPSTINNKPVVALGQYFSKEDFSSHGSFNSKGITNLVLPNNLVIIGSGAFYNNSLSKVTIPHGVDTIGASAFLNNKLEKVSLPSSLVVIGSSAFENNLITDVTLPNKIQLISLEVFAGNPLQKINIPDSVRYISPSAFDDTALTSVELPIHLKDRLLPETFKTNPAVTYRGTQIIQKDDLAIPNPETDFTWAEIDGQMTIVHYFGTRKNVHIPDTIEGKNVVGISGVYLGHFENINTYMFDSRGLTGLRLPSHLKAIYWGQFENNNLTNLQIPDSVTYIGGHAFKNNNLTNLQIPDSITEIQAHAFIENELTTVELPSHLRDEGDWTSIFDPGVTITYRP